MNGLVRTLLCTALILLCTAAQAQPPNVDGIWQDIFHPDSYFSLHIDGDRMVLVDLGSLERTDATLKSAYLGNIEESAPGVFEASLKVLTEDAAVNTYAFITLTSGTELNIYWNCSPRNCVAGIFQRIRKIF